MNGIQIEHILNSIEDQSEQNRLIIRHELVDYIAQHKQEIASALARSGQAVIPTTYGDLKLTTKDLTLAA